jgi:murein DD-endopeptidase MepM/ murein hydrolase activator NlpD
MLARLKKKFLLVIIIVAITGFIMQTENNGRQVLLPVLQYVMQPDERIENSLKVFLNSNEVTPEGELIFPNKQLLPVTGNSLVQMPCAYQSVERYFGWYWDVENNQQEFSPGVSLAVKENTPVKSIINGCVDKIEHNQSGGQVVIKKDHIKVLIGGLKEILVTAGDEVSNNSLLGKSGTKLYLEIRDQDEPLNPDALLKQ